LLYSQGTLQSENVTTWGFAALKEHCLRIRGPIRRMRVIFSKALSVHICLRWPLCDHHCNTASLTYTKENSLKQETKAGLHEHHIKPPPKTVQSPDRNRDKRTNFTFVFKTLMTLVTGVSNEGRTRPSTAVRPNSLPVIYYCIWLNCTHYGARARRPHALAFYYSFRVCSVARSLQFSLYNPEILLLPQPYNVSVVVSWCIYVYVTMSPFLRVLERLRKMSADRVVRLALLGPNFGNLVPNNTCWPQNIRLVFWLHFGAFPSWVCCFGISLLLWNIAKYLVALIAASDKIPRWRLASVLRNNIFQFMATYGN